MTKAADTKGRPCVLVVDDHESVRVALGKALENRGWRAVLAAGGRQALDHLRAGGVHVVVADLKMPGMDGIELLKAIKQISPATEVVVITAYGTVERAVEAMKVGAVDFVAKPFRRAVLMEAIERALARQCRKVPLGAQDNPIPEIVGSGGAIREVAELILTIAPSSAAVLVTGESGTGKELVAEAIHRLSARREGPLVRVSCAALSETLLESEFFGHERGAYTGAYSQRKGRFEVADGGTIFLDEVAQLSQAMQAKLLRVLQDGCFERVGSSVTRHTDVRVVAATNVDLHKAVEEGRFRADLFYRLNVVGVQLPPLRQRTEDIPALAHHFLRRYAEREGARIMGIAQEAANCLIHYSWPGNVRELENVVERAVILSRGDRVTVADLPERLRQQGGAPRDLSIPVGTPVREAERRLIQATLVHTGGDKSAAASLLGIDRRTIYRRLSGSAGPGRDGAEDESPQPEAP